MVYVDDMKMPFRNMIMCHMTADTREELLEMAAKIGINRKWIQYEGTWKEHFDVCLKMRKKAVELGAKEVTWRGSFQILMFKKSIEDLNNQLHKSTNHGKQRT